MMMMMMFRKWDRWTPKVTTDKDLHRATIVAQSGLPKSQLKMDDELVKQAKLSSAMAAQLSKNSLAKELSFSSEHVKDILVKLIGHRDVLLTHAFLLGERLGLTGDEHLPSRLEEILPRGLRTRVS